MTFVGKVFPEDYTGTHKLCQGFFVYTLKIFMSPKFKNQRILFIISKFRLTILYIKIATLNI